MKALICYSAGNDERHLAELARRHFSNVDIAYCVMRRRPILSRWDRHFIQMNGPRSSWPLYILRDVMDRVERLEQLFIVDASHHRIMDETLDDLACSSGDADFYSAGGRAERADQNGGAIVVPDWKACSIAGKLLGHPEFQTFVQALDPGLDDSGRRYAERYFFEHFRKSFAFAVGTTSAAHPGMTGLRQMTPALGMPA